MAIVDAARFKPDMNRSSLETLVTGLDITAVPIKATVYLPVQIVTYDDAAVPAYRPGDPAIEQHVTVIYEDTLQVALEGFAGMTAALALADLELRLDTWALTIKPAVPRLRQLIRAAKRISPRVI